MALAPSLAFEAWRDSGLARALKAAIAPLAIFSLAILLSACAGLGNGPDRRGEPGGRPAVAGPDGRMPRPDVSPIGPEGAAAYGSPRGPGGMGSGPLRIALLVPQSGGDKDKGDPLFDAAQMALFDAGRPDITLIVKNTANGAGAAAQSAINEGAEVIIGPFRGSDVGAVRAVAAPLGVPVFTFSSDTSVAGGGVYLMSFPLEDEVRTVVNYAASRGMGLFAVMSPQTPYARRAEAAFQRDVAAIGGQVVATAAYAPGAPSYSSVMQLDGRDFDALFLPASSKEGLQTIAGLVRFGPPPPPAPKPLTEEQIAAGVAPPPPPAPQPRAVIPDHILIGTGLWDEAGTGRSGALARGIFAASEPSAVASFANRFEGIYGHRPIRIASLAYDAVSLVATLGSAPPGQRFAQGAITDPNGFVGVDGIFRFLPNGTIQRGLAVIEVTGGGLSVIRAAPRSFQSIGS
jgi:ABC-type branched-subunit amino acid transport system substrate-binding protein